MSTNTKRAVEGTGTGNIFLTKNESSLIQVKMEIKDTFNNYHVHCLHTVCIRLQVGTIACMKISANILMQ